MSEQNSESPMQTPIERLTHVFGGMSKQERTERYFGTPPKGTYYMAPKSLARAHDLTMSASMKAKLYGIGQKPINTAGQFLDARLETDSKSDLIREVTENTNLTRAEATNLVDRWMQQNNLVEVNDPQLGKYITVRGK